MKIILIGFMGSGKSSVARVLSEKLKLQLIELDDLVLQKSGRTSINEIFEKDGEPAFRNLEKEVSLSLQNRKNAVISPGGGVVQNKLIMQSLKNNGTIIYLETPFEVIEKRFASKSVPPLFKDKVSAAKLYETRKKLYEEFADSVISTENKSIEEIAEEIIKVL